MKAILISLLTLALTVNAFAKDPKVTVEALVEVRADEADTSKKAFILKLHGYKTTAEALRAIAKLGYKPACYSCLLEVVRLNPEVARQARYLISLSLVNRNGILLFSTMTYERENKTFWLEKGWEPNIPISDTDEFSLVVVKV